MSALIVRFLIGGIVVSLFAILGDVLRPKSFAGLFGAAPSIALATIAGKARKRPPTAGPKCFAMENLRHFKALAETGEIPRIQNQPHVWETIQ